MLNQKNQRLQRKKPILASNDVITFVIHFTTTFYSVYFWLNFPRSADMNANMVE